jgi:HlyD family secretion protein
MLIVPDADLLAVDVKISPRDIDHVYGRVLLKAEELANLGSAKLVPGMPRGRTALSYLVKPLWDQAGRALRER